MQVNMTSNQNFNGHFLQTKSLKILRKTLCAADNSVLDKQFSAPKEDYHFLFNSIHNEYKYKLMTGTNLDING